MPKNEIEEESPGLVPIWMTNDLEAVSTKVIDQNSTFGRIKKPQSDKISIVLNCDSKEITIEGSGNGPIDAMIDAIKKSFNLDIKISDYHQHAISSGSDAQAVAYSELLLEGESVWGVGMHQNTVIAGLLSVISGLNRLSK